MIYRSVSGHIM